MSDDNKIIAKGKHIIGNCDSANSLRVNCSSCDRWRAEKGKGRDWAHQSLSPAVWCTFAECPVGVQHGVHALEDLKMRRTSSLLEGKSVGENTCPQMTITSCHKTKNGDA